MLRGRLDKILSVLLALLLIFCSTCYADNVFVAGAPTNTTGTVNTTGNVNIGIGNTGVGDRLYPGSLAKSSDSPTSANSITPATNKSSTIASSNIKSSSNIISNGYTWETSNTENQAPVSQESNSPGGKKVKGNNIGSRNDVSSNAGPGTNTISADNSIDNISEYFSSSDLTGGSNGSLQYAASIFNLRKVDIPDPVISSDGAILLNASTGEIYYAKNLTKTYAPAGLNALITGYLLLKSRQLTDVLTVSKTAVSNIESGATTVGLKAGDTITVQDALYALYIRSACDVANVIAENVAGSQQAFVTLMNQTATTFGTKSTVFLNPTGLNATGQISSVYDMALIMSNIIQEPALVLAMQTPVYTLPATGHRGAIKITAKNEFINPAKKNYYPGVVSSRMGYTSKARYTMASLVIHNGQYLVSVVMYSNSTHYVDSKRLMNFGRTAVDRIFNINDAFQINAIRNVEFQEGVTASQTNESLLNTSQPTSTQETAKGKSNIISNGYTWESSNTENQEPVTQKIGSPARQTEKVKKNQEQASQKSFIGPLLEVSQTTTGDGKSGIISNGYTWESSNTENQEPVVQQLKSPAGESENVKVKQSDNNLTYPSSDANANNFNVQNFSVNNSNTNIESYSSEMFDNSAASIQQVTINNSNIESYGSGMLDNNAAIIQQTTANNSTAEVVGNILSNNNIMAMQNAIGADTGGVWQQDGFGWTFTKANGQKAINEWVITGGKRYCMDANGYMITGWREFSNGAIYYFNPANGEMRYNTWVNTSTGAYYLQADGTLARADKGQTKTIATQVGNYIIDENGKAIQRVQ